MTTPMMPAEPKSAPATLVAPSKSSAMMTPMAKNAHCTSLRLSVLR